MSLGCYLWSSGMFADPEVGDHFTLNLYNSDPTAQILKYWGFQHNFFFADIFFRLFTCIRQKVVSPPPLLTHRILATTKNQILFFFFFFFFFSGCLHVFAKKSRIWGGFLFFFFVFFFFFFVKILWVKGGNFTGNLWQWFFCRTF